MIIKNIVLSSGGIKGLVYIGCLKLLEEYNLLNNLQVIIGTSIGGIFALLINIGYTSKQLEKLALNIDFSKITNITTDSILQAIENFGIDSGEKLTNLLKILIKKKVHNENITFLELYKITNKKLIVTGTCLDTNSIEYFSYETKPDMPVIEAIRITFSIPFIYNKVIYNNKHYLDGALLNDYPIQLFHETKENTIGFLIQSQSEINCKITDIISYFNRVISCIQLQFKKYQIINFEEQTIKLDIELDDITVTMGSEKKQKLIDIGYELTKKYFDKKKKTIIPPTPSKSNNNIPNDNTPEVYNIEDEINYLLADLSSEK